jgi:hypothetical protein
MESFEREGKRTVVESFLGIETSFWARYYIAGIVL